MTTKQKGEFRRLVNGFEARIRIDANTRRGFQIEAFPKDEDAARERCTAMAIIAERLRKAGHSAETEKLLEMAARARPGRSWEAITAAVDALCAGTTAKIDSATSVTFGAIATQWTSGEMHRRFPDAVNSKKTSDEDIGRFGKWVFPVAEHIAMHAFTLDHAQEVMRRLPDTSSRSTRRHVAQLMVRICNLAVYPAKLIVHSPLPKGFLPKIGKPKAMSYLYPDEDATLLGCDAVPFVHRLFYGFVCREGLRSEEAQTLAWRDVDLERGAVRLDRNKTDDARAWALDPGTVAALVAWKKLHAEDEPSDRIFRGLDKTYNLPMMLREHLKAAGVKRSELFERSDVRRQIRLHDLRATFVTTSLANGRSESWVQDRTGHESSDQINRYRRAARSFAELGLGQLKPLNEALGDPPHDCPTHLSDEPGSGVLEGTSPDEVAYAGNAEERDRLLIPLTKVRILPSEPKNGAAMGQPTLNSAPPAGAEADVEKALAEALTAAVTAGRFDVVAQLARELEARRLDRLGNVISIGAAVRSGR